MARILIVDDDPDIIEILTATLETEGHRVVTASDGEIAMAHVIESVPDLIITDVQMPNKDGYELVRELRKSALTKNTPIIILSVHSRDHERVAGLSMGADDYIPKPFHAKEVAMKVNSLLKRTEELVKFKQKEYQQKKGKVFFFAGAKGGVGTTTIALNTAIAMKNTRADTCLWDMNPGFGVIPFMLNVSSEKNLTHLLKENPLDYNKKVIEDYVAVHTESQLKILHPPKETAFELLSRSDYMHIRHVALALGEHFPITVIDAGVALHAINTLFIKECDILVLCVALDILSLFSLEALSSFLEDMKVSRDKIRVVVNSPNKFTDIRVDDIRKGAYSVLEVIENDAAGISKAMGSGKPYLSMFPKSRVSQQINSLADKLLKI